GATGRHRARQGLARRGPRGGRRSAGLGLMGRILISGTAALLICVFLSPRFIQFLRLREVGRHIREEGPEGRPAKGGTPTMGGLGVFYPVLIYLVVAGTTSAVDLTDGLDGLAAGCAAIVLLAYIGITFITPGQRDLALTASCVVGACIGFLWFNAFPATIFM